MNSTDIKTIQSVIKVDLRIVIAVLNKTCEYVAHHGGALLYTDTGVCMYVYIYIYCNVFMKKLFHYPVEVIGQQGKC